MNTTPNNPKKKAVYEKPAIQIVELVSKGVLGLNCWNPSHPTDLNQCDPPAQTCAAS